MSYDTMAGQPTREDEIATKAVEILAQKEVDEAPPQDAVVHSGFDIASMLPSAGKLCLTDPQKDVLYKKLDPSVVECRPDGLIYANWTEYKQRLIDAFGLEWAMIPEGQTGIRDNLVYRKYHLVIQGVYMTDAVGCQEYIASNRTMNYGDAVEGARSNALMRCCKHIGMTPELWKPAWIRAWKEQYAETYKDSKGKLKWRRKGAQTPQDVPDKPPEPRSQDTNPTTPVVQEYQHRESLLDGMDALIDESSYDRKEMEKDM